MVQFMVQGKFQSITEANAISLEYKSSNVNLVCDPVNITHFNFRSHIVEASCGGRKEMCNFLVPIPVMMRFHIK